MTEYKVTITEPFGCCSIAPDQIRYAIQQEIGSHYNDIIVTRYNPENERKDRSKIDAIKRIQSVYQWSLADSKFLVDTAEKNGTSRFMDVRITAYPGGAGWGTQFQVEFVE